MTEWIEVAWETCPVLDREALGDALMDAHVADPPADVDLTVTSGSEDGGWVRCTFEVDAPGWWAAIRKAGPHMSTLALNSGRCHTVWSLVGEDGTARRFTPEQIAVILQPDPGCEP